MSDRKTFNVRLTKYELTHIRDLFSIVLPTEMKVSVSQQLAKAQNRSLVEAKLWQKFVQACEEAELPMGDDAPDFVVSATAPPALGVFEVAHDPAPSQEDDPHTQGGSFFDDVEPEDEKQ